MIRNMTTPAFGVLPPTSEGSLGDQAMIDAVATHLAGMGRQIVLGLDRSATRVATKGAYRTGNKLKTIGVLAGMALRVRHMGLIGADVLDGVYHAEDVLKRLQVLKMASRLGVATRVFGSSWSQTPSEQVIAFLRNAPWLTLHARDPISKARMETALGREVVLVADLAFLLRPEITSADAQKASRWISARKAEGATVMGLNLSGHTLRNAANHGTGAFSQMIGQWLKADPNRAILLMPHDRRPGLIGDMLVLERLHQALKEDFPDRMHMLPSSLDAWELKSLAGMVDLVVSGRMHLAIAAMGMGTPSLCTVYQGKFEGLMAHFGVEGLTMTPEDVLAGDCHQQLENVTTRRNELANRIRARLPAIFELSRRNFDGI